ncbi:hypothetical protein AVEN_169559-1 [Araneus ventricosus]|uniref:Uncharacterized protein n=1 Tax=Araneus ventricosus TaxID=182803 RepID=A0A4Y2N1Q7_ARAVE|nr:hypothetical protein AVEN_169559-1 [Araneus ventricosus]
MGSVKKDNEGRPSVLDAGQGSCAMGSVKKDNEGRRSVIDAGVVKVVVVGEVRCGKTSFIRSFYDHHEPGEIYSRNFVQVYPCEFEVNKIHGRAEIFEIPSDVAFKDEQRMQYYTDAKGIIFMYASDNPTSLKLINEKWLPEAIDVINLNKTSVVLVGTK